MNKYWKMGLGLAGLAAAPFVLPMVAGGAAAAGAAGGAAGAAGGAAGTAGGGLFSGLSGLFGGSAAAGTAASTAGTAAATDFAALANPYTSPEFLKLASESSTGGPVGGGLLGFGKDALGLAAKAAPAAQVGLSMMDKSQAPMQPGQVGRPGADFSGLLAQSPQTDEALRLQKRQMMIQGLLGGRYGAA